MLNLKVILFFSLFPHFFSKSLSAIPPQDSFQYENFIREIKDRIALQTQTFPNSTTIPISICYFKKFKNEKKEEKTSLVLKQNSVPMISMESLKNPDSFRSYLDETQQLIHSESSPEDQNEFIYSESLSSYLKLWFQPPENIPPVMISRNSSDIQIRQFISRVQNYIGESGVWLGTFFITIDSMIIRGNLDSSKDIVVSAEKLKKIKQDNAQVFSKEFNNDLSKQYEQLVEKLENDPLSGTVLSCIKAIDSSEKNNTIPSAQDFLQELDPDSLSKTLHPQKNKEHLADRKLELFNFFEEKLKNLHSDLQSLCKDLKDKSFLKSPYAELYQKDLPRLKLFYEEQYRKVYNKFLYLQAQLKNLHNFQEESLSSLLKQSQEDKLLKISQDFVLVLNDLNHLQRELLEKLNRIRTKIIQSKRSDILFLKQINFIKNKFLNILQLFQNFKKNISFSKIEDHLRTFQSTYIQQESSSAFINLLMLKFEQLPQYNEYKVIFDPFLKKDASSFGQKKILFVYLSLFWVGNNRITMPLWSRETRNALKNYWDKIKDSVIVKEKVVMIENILKKNHTSILEVDDPKHSIEYAWNRYFLIPEVHQVWQSFNRAYVAYQNRTLFQKLFRVSSFLDKTDYHTQETLFKAHPIRISFIVYLFGLSKGLPGINTSTRYNKVYEKSLAELENLGPLNSTLLGHSFLKNEWIEFYNSIHHESSELLKDPKVNSIKNLFLCHSVKAHFHQSIDHDLEVVDVEHYTDQDPAKTFHALARSSLSNTFFAKYSEPASLKVEISPSNSDQILPFQASYIFGSRTLSIKIPQNLSSFSKWTVETLFFYEFIKVELNKILKENLSISVLNNDSFLAYKELVALCLLRQHVLKTNPSKWDTELIPQLENDFYRQVNEKNLIKNFIKHSSLLEILKILGNPQKFSELLKILNLEKLPSVHFQLVFQNIAFSLENVFEPIDKNFLTINTLKSLDSSA